MSLGSPIAIGYTAEVYAWKPGQVLKLFNPGFPLAAVEWEAGLSRIASTTSLPVPRAGEIVEIDGRFGLEYERVDGVSMLDALLREPWKCANYARSLARLQVEMHRLQVPEMPSMRENLVRKIHRATVLPGNLRQAALDRIAQLPEMDNLCHGDFHPNNILLSSRGPVIIDWIDATRGYPLADVARSSILFGGGRIPPGMKKAWLVKLVRLLFHRIYLEHYFEITHADRKLLPGLIPLIAAARLDENIRGDEGRLLAIAHGLIMKT